jgi:hypothetical protein
MSQPLQTAGKALVPLAMAGFAAAVAAAGLYLKWKYDGWLTLVPGLFLYPAVCIAHVTAHLRPATRFADRPELLDMILLSHGCLIAAFLLQYDLGDGPRWLTITEMLGIQLPSWWPHEVVGIPLNFLLFGPAVWTWIKLRNQSSEGTEEGPEGTERR